MATNAFGSVHSERARLDVLVPAFSPQELSVSFDLGIGNVETVNKNSYKHNMANATAKKLTQHQSFELDIEASGEKQVKFEVKVTDNDTCLLYTSPSPRDGLLSRMPSSA